MPSLFRHLYDLLRDGVKKTHIKRRQKVNGTETKVTNNDVDSKRANRYASRPSLESVFPDLDMTDNPLTSPTYGNPVHDKGMLDYRPKATQDFNMAYIIDGEKYESSVSRCRSDIDLRNFGLLDPQSDYSFKPSKTLPDKNRLIISTHQWSKNPQKKSNITYRSVNQIDSDNLTGSTQYLRHHSDSVCELNNLDKEQVLY